MANDPKEETYGLSPEKTVNAISAPPLDYLPPKPKTYRPKIGIIGTGGISEFHLKAYRTCGFDIAALHNRTRGKAEARRDEFFPAAQVYERYQDILADDAIEVVDITPHPEARIPIIREALAAGKHVLSQKPFALDLDTARELADLADAHRVKLAVNQNGRWAPHFSYMRHAITSGLIGDVTSVDFNLQWDQTWIAGNEQFENINHLILFDFGVHWFDIAACFMGDTSPQCIFAAATTFKNQDYRPPAIASAIIDYPNAQVRMSFNAHTKLGEQDTTTVVGTKGTLRSRGPGLNEQPQMEVYLENGQVSVPLEGCWFENGFQGAMGELLCAIEENREPNHSARNNLRTIELVNAATKSADTKAVVTFP
ncbi:MAG: putative dehydrogenase [Pseudoalteromonas tetraodonis]|jgi:predicted dehydrogenase